MGSISVFHRLMQAVSLNKTHRPRLGIVLLDLPHFSARSGSFEPDDLRGLGTLGPGAFESPATWSLPTVYEVAVGANVEATLGGAAAATEGVREAVRSLDGRCELIIGDCGFFWAASQRFELESRSPAFLSALDLIEPLAHRTSGEIGVLTYSVPHLEQILADHPRRAQLRFAGVAAEPGWSRLGVDEYGLNLDWEMDELEAELEAVLRREFDLSGALHGISALVLECTLIPQFRAAIRRITTAPILDLASLADAQLSRQPCVPRLTPSKTKG